MEAGLRRGFSTQRAREFPKSYTNRRVNSSDLLNRTGAVGSSANSMTRSIAQCLPISMSHLVVDNYAHS